MMKLLVDNNKTFSWNKTIIDFGIGCYLVYQPLKTYIHLACGSVNITFFQVFCSISHFQNFFFNYRCFSYSQKDKKVTRQDVKDTIVWKRYWYRP
jgi:hypothetical protein